MHGGACGCFGEQGVEIAKIFLQFAKLPRIHASGGAFDGESQLRLVMPEFAFEDLTGTGDGVALVVEEALDTKGHFDVAAAIETLACAAFVRLELRELALPETQDVGGDVAELSDFAYTEV